MTKNSILLWRRAERIRKVESERPLEGEPSSRLLEKERLHPNISNEMEEISGPPTGKWRDLEVRVKI